MDAPRSGASNESRDESDRHSGRRALSAVFAAQPRRDDRDGSDAEGHRTRAALQSRRRVMETHMAQAAPPSTPYGAPISIDAARKAMAAAEAEAAKNNWGVAIAIVDSGANLVMLHRLDNE